MREQEDDLEAETDLEGGLDGRRQDPEPGDEDREEDIQGEEDYADEIQEQKDWVLLLEERDSGEQLLEPGVFGGVFSGLALPVGVVRSHVRLDRAGQVEVGVICYPGKLLRGEALQRPSRDHLLDQLNKPLHHEVERDHLPVTVEGVLLPEFVGSLLLRIPLFGSAVLPSQIPTFHGVDGDLGRFL